MTAPINVDTPNKMAIGLMDFAAYADIIGVKEIEQLQDYLKAQAKEPSYEPFLKEFFKAAIKYLEHHRTDINGNKLPERTTL